MGEFFMPYPGTRVDQETTALSAKAMSGGASALRGEVQRRQQTERPDLGRSGRSVGAERPAGRGEPALVRGVAGHWERPGGQGGSHDAGRIRPSAAGAPGCTRARPGRTGTGTRTGHRLRHPHRAHRLRHLRRAHRLRHRAGPRTCAGGAPTPGQPAGGNGPAPAPGAIST